MKEGRTRQCKDIQELLKAEGREETLRKIVWYLRSYAKHQVIEAYDWEDLKPVWHRQLQDSIEESTIDVIRIQKDKTDQNGRNI